MQYYFQINLLPDPEFLPTVLMNALYNKFHRALTEMQCTEIGISFPAYVLVDVNDEKTERKVQKKTLGMSIRFHGSKERLEQLMKTSWLAGMYDHIRLGNICEIPGKVGYVKFVRVQMINNIERIRRRQMKRLDLTYDQAMERFAKIHKKPLSYPFVTLKSKSTDQVFRLFIKKIEVEEAQNGAFNTYGLSKTATVPIF